jgi:threonine aldolase
MPVDLRSDTVTQPTPSMRQAMMDAPLGDVCMGDDPTVLRLEALAAERLGKEAAIFVPTGSMSNQIAVALHAGLGEAAIVEASAHIANWEGGGAAASSGVQLRPVHAEDGLPTCEQLEDALWPQHPKAPRLRVLCMENTHNGRGGIPHPASALAERATWARSHDLTVHLDGARLFNAQAATGDSAAELGASCDTVNICLSKGLGAPIGSILAGPAPLIEEADRVRHRLGGGWRQAGMLAAAGIHALEHHVARLATDHAHARALSEALAASGIAEAYHDVRTNLVCYRVNPGWGPAAQLTQTLAEGGVLVLHTGPTTGRLVTHLDVSEDDVAQAIQVIRAL